MGRRVVVVFCMALLALVGVDRASAFRTSQWWLKTDDNVQLMETLFEPDSAPPAGGYPAIVLFHAIGGKRQDLEPVAARFASTFAVLTFDARGHGESGGQTSIAGPRELADTRAVFDQLAGMPEINRQEIGAWGLSMGGGTLLRSLVEGVPWAAVETAETWTDLFTSLAPQNLSKSGAIYQFLSSVAANRLDPSVSAIENDAIASTNLAFIRQFATPRSSRSLLSQVHTPVLFMQGRRDFAFDIDQATAGFRLVKGPKELYVGDFGHAPSTFPGPDFNAMMAYGENWFRRWLLHQPLAPFSPVVVAPNPWRGKARAFKALPATRTARFSFAGNDTLTGEGKGGRTSGRTHTKLETFGNGRLHLQARLSGGWERLVAVLTATTAKHKTTVISEGGVNTMGMSGRHELTIKLISDATLIPKGSRLSLTLASNSLAQDPNNLLYLDLPQPPAAKVKLGPARLDLPVLEKAISR